MRVYLCVRVCMFRACVHAYLVVIVAMAGRIKSRHASTTR
jgi:hypothetical protein